jgi:hypothetical protein
MYLALFHQAERRVYCGTRGRKSKYGHTFGGGTDYAGLAAFKHQPPVHLLFRLNMLDPAVGVRLPGLQWLPLLCAIRYGACDLGYRVMSDERVKILHQGEKKAWDGFPTNTYPDELPPKPLALHEAAFDPGNPRDAFFYGGVFGYEHLSPKQFARVVRYVKGKGFYDSEDSEYETAEEFLQQGSSLMFVQGRPTDACPNRRCSNHRRRSSLRTFAVFEEEDSKAKQLWGPNGENLQIIYQVCPACGAIHTTNQCT